MGNETCAIFDLCDIRFKSTLSHSSDIAQFSTLLEYFDFFYSFEHQSLTCKAHETLYPMPSPKLPKSFTMWPNVINDHVQVFIPNVTFVMFSMVGETTLIICAISQYNGVQEFIHLSHARFDTFVVNCALPHQVAIEVSRLQTTRRPTWIHCFDSWKLPKSHPLQLL